LTEFVYTVCCIGWWRWWRWGGRQRGRCRGIYSGVQTCQVGTCILRSVDIFLFRQS